MALINKLAHDEGFERIPNHAFSAACWFWAKGELSRADVIAMFGLEASDEAQLDQLAAHYQALSDADKRAFHSDLESAGILLEGGFITKAQYGSLLGVT